MSIRLPLGKLPSTLLAELIGTLPVTADELIIPPGIGCDSAGLQIGTQKIAVTTDPVTFATRHLATYSVCISINDVACLGCRPRWYSGTLLLPPKISEAELRRIWLELGNTLRKYDMVSIGGHAEVTTSVNIPIIVGQVIGEVIGNHLLNPADACPGDQILLWQGAAIEGTALLATERAQDLKQLLPKEEVIAMQQLLYSPGICVWPLVQQLLPDEGVVALHDPTEGGIATALHELADGTRCGIQVYADRIPILPATLKLAQLFKVDPLGLLASGSLLIVCRPDSVNRICEKFGAAHIGELVNNPKRIKISKNSGSILPRYDTDEVIRALATKLF